MFRYPNGNESAPEIVGAVSFGFDGFDDVDAGDYCMAERDPDTPAFYTSIGHFHDWISHTMDLTFFVGNNLTSTGQAAETYCNAMGAQLAKITTQEDFETARAKCRMDAPSGGSCHIALEEKRTAGYWMWPDSEHSPLVQESTIKYPQSASWWAPDQPDDGGKSSANGDPNTRNGDQKCVMMNSVADYFWDDVDCQATDAYPLCMRSPELHNWFNYATYAPISGGLWQSFGNLGLCEGHCHLDCDCQGELVLPLHFQNFIFTHV